jgi:hypothetical protein
MMNASQINYSIRTFNFPERFKEYHPKLFNYLNFNEEKWENINKKHSNWNDILQKLPVNSNGCVVYSIDDWTLPLILIESKANDTINNLRKLFISSVENIYNCTSPMHYDEISKMVYNIFIHDNIQFLDFTYEILVLNYYISSGYKIIKLANQIFDGNNNNVEYTLQNKNSIYNIEVKTKRLGILNDSKNGIKKFFKLIKSDIKTKYEKKKLSSNNVDFIIGHVISPTKKTPNYSDLIKILDVEVKNTNPFELTFGYNIFGFVPSKEGPAFYSFIDKSYLNESNQIISAKLN